MVSVFSAIDDQFPGFDKLRIEPTWLNLLIVLRYLAHLL